VGEKFSKVHCPPTAVVMTDEGVAMAGRAYMGGWCKISYIWFSERLGWVGRGWGIVGVLMTWRVFYHLD